MGQLLVTPEIGAAGEKAAGGGERRVRAPIFFLLALLVGIVAGGGAVVFRWLIALFHNLLFLGKLSPFYNATVHTPASPLGPWIIAVPAGAALVVAFLVKTWAPEARGHGAPEVMEAIYYHQGKIRPVVGVIKSLASALSIGSGAPVGREGPMVQIGSSFGSTLGTFFRVPAWQRITLVAAGAGSGIAATFNTPVGGVLFAVELMLHEVSARTLVPVVIATATATWIGRAVFGPHPAFTVPELAALAFHTIGPWLLLAYAGLGCLAGLISALFIKTLYGFERFFEQRVRGSYYRQHALGMLLVGGAIYAMKASFGHYYIQGVGYSTVQDVLSNVQIGGYLLVLLFALKLTATSITLGSGASGGILSPSLYLGATAGGAFGMALRWLAPHLGISPPAFALVGMAGVVGGATGAAMTSIVMVFEMTLDYNVIVPMTLCVAISYAVRRALSRESVYTEKPALRGHPVPEALQANIYALHPARDLADNKFAAVPASAPLAKLQHGEQKPRWVVALDGDRVAGYLDLNAVGPVAQQTVGDAARRDFCWVPEDARLTQIARTMARTRSSMALVLRKGAAAQPGDILGIIPKSGIADALASAVELFEG